MGKILDRLSDRLSYQLFYRAGKYSLIVVVFLVALHHWDIMQLDKIPVPHFVDILYAYIVVNAGFAAPFIYLERKAQIAVGKRCPQCGKDLERIISYRCSECGEIKYEKK